MFSRVIVVTAIFLCMIFASQAVGADDVEVQIKNREARLIYEAASKLMDDEKYDKALRRFVRIMSEYPETEYARLAKRRKLEAIALKFEPPLVRGMSRASLVGFGTLFTTWLGIGTLIMADLDDPEPYGIILIAAPLAGMLGSLHLTRKMKLSDGQVSLINLGGYWAIWQATGAAIIAGVDERIAVGASMAGGIIGLAISGSVVKNRYFTSGNATMINFGGIWGTWFALCGAMIADLEEEDNVLISSMIGGNAGLFTMAVLAPQMRMSRARARLINVSGIIGVLYGLGTNLLFEIDHKSDFWGVLGVGSVLGLAAGAYFTRHYDAEDGYFAGDAISDAIYQQNIGTGVPSVGYSYENSRGRRRPGINLRIPLFITMF